MGIRFSNMYDSDSYTNRRSLFDVGMIHSTARKKGRKPSEGHHTRPKRLVALVSESMPERTGSNFWMASLPSQVVTRWNYNLSKARPVFQWPLEARVCSLQ